MTIQLLSEEKARERLLNHVARFLNEDTIETACDAFDDMLKDSVSDEMTEDLLRPLFKWSNFWPEHLAKKLLGLPEDDDHDCSDLVERFENQSAQLAEASTTNRNLSFLDYGMWYLHNINGPLAVVTGDSSVIAVGHFWNAYERLSEEGKCDSPGGAEYRRVLMEWIEASPDNMEEFIVRRANAGPYEPFFAD